MELGLAQLGSDFALHFGFKVSFDRKYRLKIRPTGKNATLDGGVSSALPPDLLVNLRKLAGDESLSSPFAAMGRSGVMHTFTFGSKEGDSTRVVCDMVSGSTPVDETKVLSLFIKVYDVGAAHALLCATPSLSADAKKLAGIYNMTVIEAADRDSAVKKVADAFRHTNRPT